MARAVCGSIVTVFAVAVGHLAWHVYFGPPVTPKHFVGGELKALAGLDPSHKQLYLRRDYYLSKIPRHAWLQVLGHDRLTVFVNGELVADKTLDGFPVAVVANLTPYLRTGANAIAITARQSSIGKPPVVAVSGAYVLDDGEHPIEPDERWRCREVFERGAHWWYAPDFIDRHWPSARLTTCNLRAAVTVPPRALTTASAGSWITPPALEDGSAAVRRDFEIAGRPRHAWMRLTATSSYRLAVNGILLDEQEDQLATTTPLPPVQRIYDISSVVHGGRNVLALVLTGITGPPHLQADVEVEDQSGQRYQLGSDGNWLSRPGLPDDWLADPGHASMDWRPCLAETGFLNVMPWQVRQKVVEISLPLQVRVVRAVEQIGLMIAIALLTLLVCRRAKRWLSIAWNRPHGATPIHAVYLPLVLPTLAIGAGVLAAYDPRFGPQDVYHGLWLGLTVAALPLQWLMLALIPLILRSDGRLACRMRSKGLVVALLSILLGAGAWLRLRNLETEPMHWDEVEVYRNTMGFLEHGYPSIEFHPDAPRVRIHTSELLFVSTGLAALVFDDDRYVVRFPAVCWSILTIGLIFQVGRRLFGVPAGLLAAGIYTFSPVCISMSHFGRYFAQLQFLTLLTAYFFWLAIQGTGPLNRRALWLTAFGFIAAFLTWEAAALMAPPMVLAALWQRRGRLYTVLANLSVWAALVVTAMTVLLQQIHLVRMQSQLFWYGVSLSDVTLKPMWRYPGFQPFYYVWESSWNQDMLLPMMSLVGAGLLGFRHAFRRQIRFLLLIYLGTCLVMVLILPNVQWRYIYHTTPFLILLASAALAAGGRCLVKLARQAGTPSACWRVYGRGLAVGLAVAAIALASGLTIQLPELPRFCIEGHGRLTTFQFPNLGGPAQYLREHVRAGDAVLSGDFQQIHHLMGVVPHSDRRPEPDRPNDYWLATTLFLPATLDDRRSLPLDRRDGSVMIPSRESLEALFARQGRVWYVVQPGVHQQLNTPDVSAFLRQHMEVVYEDWQALVLFRGEHHRSAHQRQRDDAAIRNSPANFLP